MCHPVSTLRVCEDFDEDFDVDFDEDSSHTSVALEDLSTCHEDFETLTFGTSKSPGPGSDPYDPGCDGGPYNGMNHACFSRP